MYDEILCAVNKKLEAAQDINGKQIKGLSRATRMRNFLTECYSMPLFSSVTDLITSSTSRVFVGPELCQNEEWLRTATGYTLDVHKASEELFTYPAIVRPLVVLFLRSYRQLRGRFGVARRLLLPAFKERTSKNGIGNQDMLQWLVDAAQGRDSEPDRLVKRMLFLNMAAIHTTATTATNMLLDPCARPEYIDILRQEMTTAIQEDGGIKPSTLPKLKKLDSFMRESRRLNTLGFCE